jgi:murein DD-endopeptidase MepM/ murein hydrolase activator NlpD
MFAWTKKLCLAIIFLFIFAQLASATVLPVTSPFGWRYHPIDGQYKFHAGVDLAYELGTPIPALYSGVVVFSGVYGGHGNAVYIYHPNSNSYTGYAHCHSLVVVAGQEVQQGEIIAYVGNSGYSTGSHLHLEYIIAKGSGWEYADPLLLWQGG